MILPSIEGHATSYSGVPDRVANDQKLGKEPVHAMISAYRTTEASLSTEISPEVGESGGTMNVAEANRILSAE